MYLFAAGSDQTACLDRTCKVGCSIGRSWLCSLVDIWPIKRHWLLSYHRMLSLELLLYEIIAFLFLSLIISFGSCLFVRNVSSLILLNVCTFGRSCFLCSGSLCCLPWWFLWIIHKCVFNKCTTKVCVILRWCPSTCQGVIDSPSRQIHDFLLLRL